jgi:predicted enzyme related to lactoylglutathione lyase
MTALHLAQVALIVPDYDAAIAFFTAIGFELTADIDQGRKRWVTVSSGGIGIVLARADSPAQTNAIGNQAGGRVWLFLHTDDFARDHARILAAGGHFEEEPRHEPYGIVAVWAGIWGNRWDLIQQAAV